MIPLSHAQSFSTKVLSMSTNNIGYNQPTYSSLRRNSLTLTTAPLYSLNGPNFDFNNHSDNYKSRVNSIYNGKTSNNMINNDKLSNHSTYSNVSSTSLPSASVSPIILSTMKPSLPNNHPSTSSITDNSNYLSRNKLRRSSIHSTDSCTKCDHHHQQSVKTLRSMVRPATTAVRTNSNFVNPPQFPNKPIPKPSKNNSSSSVSSNSTTASSNKVKEELLHDIYTLNTLINEEQNIELSILQCINRANQSLAEAASIIHPSLHPLPKPKPNRMSKSNTSMGKSRHTIELSSPPSHFVGSRYAPGLHHTNNLSSLIPTVASSSNLLYLLQQDRQELIYKLLTYPKDQVLHHLHQQIQVLQSHQKNYYELYYRK